MARVNTLLSNSGISKNEKSIILYYWGIKIFDDRMRANLSRDFH
jgi:hypothetical protein